MAVNFHETKNDILKKIIHAWLECRDQLSKQTIEWFYFKIKEINSINELNDEINKLNISYEKWNITSSEYFWYYSWLNKLYMWENIKVENDLYNNKSYLTKIYDKFF
jgi:hypothetical protein